MNRSHRILVVLPLLVAIFAAITYSALRPNEPAYRGKRLRKWLDDLYDERPEKREPAIVAVKEIGTNAIPQLLAMLDRTNPPLQEKLIKFLKRTWPGRFNLVTEQEYHIRALVGFQTLGPQASPAIPALTKLLNRLDRSLFAAEALACIGEKAIPSLSHGLTNPTLRLPIILSIESFGTNISAFGPMLLQNLGDSNYPARYHAARALTKFPGLANESVPALISALKDSNALVREQAARSLAALGERARSAVPALAMSLLSDDVELRRQAAIALRSIDPEAAAKAGLK